MQNSFAVVSVMLRTLDIWVVGFLGFWVPCSRLREHVQMGRQLGKSGPPFHSLSQIRRKKS